MSDKPSWRKLDALKLVKRNDQGMWARPDAIRIIPGFNLRDVEAPGYSDDIDALEAHLLRGGKVPALEVCLSADGQGVDVVDGHRRTEAYKRIIAAGKVIEWIRIEPFDGNDLERQKRILTSQDNRKLLPLELAEGYRRLKAFGLSSEEIAQSVGKSRQNVEAMLILASGPHAVHLMVRDGIVTASLAIDAIREHGDGAAEVLGQANQQAKAAGKSRVTASVLRPWTPPARAVQPMLTAVSAVVGAIPEQTRQALLDKPEAVETITLPAHIVYELLAQQGAIDALRRKAEKKASEPGKDGK